MHFYLDNMTALFYLIHKGGTKSLVLTKISKEIWEYVQERGITITASWIPSELNKEADRRSRLKQNSREWEFKRLTQRWGEPEIDCFASRIMKKLHAYMSLSPDPEYQAVNALYQDWEDFNYLFSILLNRSSSENNSSEVNTSGAGNSSVMARAYMVSNIAPLVHIESYSTVTITKPAQKHSKNTHTH